MRNALIWSDTLLNIECLKIQEEKHNSWVIIEKTLKQIIYFFPCEIYDFYRDSSKVLIVDHKIPDCVFMNQSKYQNVMFYAQRWFFMLSGIFFPYFFVNWTIKWSHTRLKGFQNLLSNTLKSTLKVSSIVKHFQWFHKSEILLNFKILCTTIWCRLIIYDAIHVFLTISTFLLISLNCPSTFTK